MKLGHVLLLSILFTVGCSTMETYQNVGNLQSLRANQNFQVKVQTGNLVMDQLIYELAHRDFGKYLPISEQEPYTGCIEVTFMSSSEGAFIGSGTAFATSTAQGNLWYTGSGYASLSATGTTTATGIYSGGTFTWQNSTMFVSIKDSAGKRLWTADYKYKGGWEVSGWYVNTADEAARYCIQMISKELAKSFAN
jgi:hypothetical protein